MKKKYLIFFLGFYFFSNAILAQEIVSKTINGKINTNTDYLENINVFNLHTKTNTVSDAKGNFSIMVSVGDTLQFSSIQLKTVRYKINKDDLSKSVLVFKMQSSITELQEVTIEENKNINAVSLRILEKPAKTYTPAERKLYTAGDFKWYHLLAIPLGGMPLDPLFNKINGRTKMLKKELAVEKKEFAMEKLDNLFDENYFINKLKIPEEYVNGFIYYVVEDENLIKALKAKNKTLMEFVLNDLAVKYLEILKEK